MSSVEGCWVRCDTLIDRWRCGPHEVDTAFREKGLCDKVDVDNRSIYWGPLSLDNFFIHSHDLARFEAENAEYLALLCDITPSDFPETMERAAKVLGVDGLSCSATITGLLKVVEGRCRKIVTQKGDACNEMIGSPANKTKAASEARDKQTAERWKGHLSASVKATIEIVKNDVRQYTKRELVKLIKKHGADWTNDSEPMKAFRDALPDEYINHGGAPKQDLE